MKSLHIRDVDEIAMERLRILAQLHHRSVQREFRAGLEEATQRAPGGYIGCDTSAAHHHRTHQEHRIGVKPTGSLR